MLRHLNKNPKNPTRVVILGGAGFVGSTTASALQKLNIDVKKVVRQDIDLLSPNTTSLIKDILKPNDTLVIACAMAPCKNSDMLKDNIIMMENICKSIKGFDLNHVIYVSSDAVYSDSDSPLTEKSITAPTSMHGIMHLAREIMLADNVGDTPLAIVRPTLLYGINDPHNGYGPNQYRRLANDNEDIALFGKGEEKRDHVLINDVAEIIKLIIQHKSCGTLNIATGQTMSFFDIASKTIEIFKSKSKIYFKPRSGPMPHNGYRPFDISNCKKAFPNFSYASLDEGIRLTKTLTNDLEVA